MPEEQNNQTNLASDIKAKLQEKKYFIKEVKVEIDDSENFNIEKIYIYLNNDNKGKIKENDKKIVVNEIEKVELQLGDKKVNEIESNITDNEKADEKTLKSIKKYLSDVYNINIDKIKVY